MKFAQTNEAAIVSVCLITYKHEPFIQQAIESVLMQQTSFASEFIIAEDLSPDGTRKIVQEYASRFPIKLILQKTNVGAERNWLDLLTAATGKYVAYLEGDDYWTDSNKLEQQVQQLEADNTLSITYHHCNSLVDGNIINNDPNRNKSFYFSLKDSLYGKAGFSVSMMYKRSEIDLIQLATLTKDRLVGDWPTELLLLAKGKRGYFDHKTMAIYREHLGGVTKYRRINKAAFLLDRIEVCKRLLEFTTQKRTVRFFLGELYLHLSLYQSHKLKHFSKGMGLLLMNAHFTKSFNHNTDHSYRNFLKLIFKRIQNKFKSQNEPIL